MKPSSFRCIRGGLENAYKNLSFFRMLKDDGKTCDFLVMRKEVRKSLLNVALFDGGSKASITLVIWPITILGLPLKLWKTVPEAPKSVLCWAGPSSRSQIRPNIDFFESIFPWKLSRSESVRRHQFFKRMPILMVPESENLTF